MLASILCCPFYSISAQDNSTNENTYPESSLQLLFHSMAREIRVRREGYLTRFHKAGHLPTPSKSSSQPLRLSVRDHMGGGRTVVVQDDAYIGQVGERNEQRSGIGVAWMKATREIYMGEWRDNKPHGWGVLYSPRERRRMWMGNWIAGRALSSSVEFALDTSSLASSSSSPSVIQRAGLDLDARRSK